MPSSPFPHFIVGFWGISWHTNLTWNVSQNMFDKIAFILAYSTLFGKFIWSPLCFFGMIFHNFFQCLFPYVTWKNYLLIQTSASCMLFWWMRCRHCSDFEAWGASGKYKAWGASGNYEAWGASGRKYKVRMVIFCILAAVNRFSLISRKEESCWEKSESRWGKLGSRWGKSESRWRKQKAVEESRKPLKKIKFCVTKIGF